MTVLRNNNPALYFWIDRTRGKTHPDEEKDNEKSNIYPQRLLLSKIPCLTLINDIILREIWSIIMKRLSFS